MINLNYLIIDYNNSNKAKIWNKLTSNIIICVFIKIWFINKENFNSKIQLKSIEQLKL